nr:probable pyridoxal 5'-phosphate synthase subunit PDX2 [Ipomoea batatas]
MAVGVLALQGSFNEHIAALRRLGVKGIEIRKAEQLQSVSSLIIPGGESTTMAKLAEFHNLFPALREFVKMGKPVWGTCAGLIFLADKAVEVGDLFLFMAWLIFVKCYMLESITLLLRAENWRTGTHWWPQLYCSSKLFRKPGNSKNLLLLLKVIIVKKYFYSMRNKWLVNIII